MKIPATGMAALSSALVLAGLAWTHFSVLSPVHGWTGRCIAEASRRLRRVLANVPCDPCSQAVAQIGEISLSYPAALGRHLESRIEENDMVTVAFMNPTQSCGFGVTVTKFPVEKMEAIRSMFQKSGDLQTCGEEERRGWKVRRCYGSERGHIAMAGVLGARHLVTVDAVLADYLRDTKLHEWTLDTFEDVQSVWGLNDSQGIDGNVQCSPSNFGLNPTVVPVTGLACARPAPGTPAG